LAVEIGFLYDVAVDEAHRAHTSTNEIRSRWAS
jgi:hypothetical protein